MAKRKRSLRCMKPVGFWLYDFLVDMGVSASVTPPSLIPSQSGNLKTDPIASWRIIRTCSNTYVPI